MRTTTATLLLFALAAMPARAQHGVSLTWTASSDADANPSLTYNVYRSTTCTGAFSKLNASPVAATSYLDSALAPGSYCYQITSSLSGTEGTPSNQAAVLIPTPALPQQTGCPRRGNLLIWRRCVSAMAHAQPKEGKSTR